MGISVMRAARADVLVEALARTLAGIREDPFSGDLVIVPTRGIERYLTQAIADRNGLAANIDFPSPAEFLDRVTAGGEDPWDPSRAVWPLLDVIGQSIDAGLPWSEPLARHLRTTDDWRREDRAFPLAERLARLFASYALQRPALIADWEDGASADIPVDLAWQYPLWRALRRRIGVGPLDARIDSSGLPPRLALFGATRIPERLLDVVRHLARDLDVAVYLTIASPGLWEREGWTPSLLRRHDASRGLARHPLGRSLGRDTRELRLRLGGGGTTLRTPEPPATMLGRLQREIRSDTRSTIDTLPADDSLQVHACHGPARQVEIVREAVLSLLQEHPALQPRDVIIMTPDLETYAPILSAAFAHPDPRIADLRLAVADRSKEQHNEVLGAVDALLALVAGRVKRSEVLDLVKRTPVRERFRLSEDDVGRLEELCVSAHIRWGVDARQRADFGLAEIDQGTWSWGLDRMALGTAMSEADLAVFHEVLALPDVTSADAAAVGALARLLDRLSRFWQQTRSSATLRQWTGMLAAAIEDFTDARYATSWQAAHAQGAIAQYAAAAGGYADTVELSLAEVRSMLQSVLAGRATRAGFRLGGVTACQLEPMRSVPYPVVCLVGLDDGAFPRAGGRDGDDLLLRDPRVGERDARSEDRQLFLDAIMAATEHLVIAYTGRDPRTNDPREPAVPLAELIELLPDDSVQRHPLQPFDPRCFQPGRPFSHDRAALAGARAALGPREPWRFLSAPLAAPDPLPERSLDSLAKYLKDPPSTFLERRLGLRVQRGSGQADEGLAANLGPLDRFGVGNRLLQQRLRAGDAGSVIRAERLLGVVPPGRLGTDTIDRRMAEVDAVLQHYEAWRGGESIGPATFAVDLGGGRAVPITVPDVCGTSIMRATFAKIKVAHVLGIWPELLALAAAFPDQAWSAKVSARGGWLDLAAPAAQQARAILERMFALAEAGLRRPSPLMPETGFAYAKAQRGRDPVAAGRAAGKAWLRERTSQSVMLAFGADAPLERLLAEEPLQDEQHPAETTGFGSLARHVFDPLLDQDGDAGITTWPSSAAVRGRAIT